MNQPGALIGIVLAAVVVAAAFVAPQVLPRRPAAELAAAEKATLATRQLYRYAQNAEALKKAGGLEALREADFEKLVVRSDGSAEGAKSPFDLLQEQFEGVIAALRKSDQERSSRGTTAAGVRAPALDAAGVRASVDAALKWLAENEKILAAAEAAAREAVRDGPGVLGVHQPLGIALLIRASEAFDAATRVRCEAATQRQALLARLTEWKLTSIETRGAADMSPAKAITDLRAELDKITRQKGETDAEVARLKSEIADREAKLTSVRALLTSNRKRLSELEGVGFSAGNDSSFEAYRATYRSISEELATLEEQEQQWSLGGRKGASFVGEDVLAGAVEGGDAIIGVEELTRALEVAEGTASQLEAGQAAVQARIDSLQTAVADYARQKKRGDDRLAALRITLDGLLKRIDELTNEANDREAAAIDAAQNAARAFRDERNVAEQWKSDAARIRSERDPNGQNSRLSAIQNDRFVDLDGAGAEIAARLLEARVHAQRVAATEAHLQALEEMRVTIENSEITNKADIEKYVQSAREAGISTLKEAQELCGGLTGGGNTAWIGQGLLAATHFIHSLVDAAGADAHRADALKALEAAVEKREKSPYIPEYLRLRDMLKAGADGNP